MSENLRIAIRQLERAELYLVALYSLDLDGVAPIDRLDSLLGQLRGLRQEWVNLKQQS